MKQLIVFLSSIFFSVTAFAQKKGVVTEHYNVLGNCGTCKKRIENAAFIKGVKRVEWNKTTKDLTLTYDNTKVGAEDVMKSIAKVGHESELVKVSENDPAYKKLPSCCAYKSNTCEDDE